MVDNRDAILKGVKAAHTLHRDLGIREPLERSNGGGVDVFVAIGKLGATLMFQPLDKLLGAYVPVEEPGILITTKRTLPVQRFTAAHELGHLYMRHRPSLDDNGILYRAPFSVVSQLERQEREADAFASMFLAPADAGGGGKCDQGVDNQRQEPNYQCRHDTISRTVDERRVANRP